RVSARRRIRLSPPRAPTMRPARGVLAPGLPAPNSWVISQGVLSFGIPFALVPLVLLPRRADIMGPLVNRRRTTAAAACIAAMITALNVYLLCATFAA